jgi:ActR/RegA family two-component response regulator
VWRIVELTAHGIEVLDMGVVHTVVSAVSARPIETTLEAFIVWKDKTMSSPPPLEFMLVCDDYPTLTAVSAGVKKFGAALTFVPSSDSARNCLDRRKIDAVFVDQQVSGALQLIESIRKGTSNSKAVIFACVADSRASTPALSAGANFALKKPVTADDVTRHITIAKDLMISEHRRYFRHAVNLHILLKDEHGQQHGKITNLSEGGLTVRTATSLKHSALVEFAFDLSFGTTLTGKGQVAWVNTEGMAGVIFRFFHGTGQDQVKAWLDAREQPAPKSSPA